MCLQLTQHAELQTQHFSAHTLMAEAVVQGANVLIMLILTHSHTLMEHPSVPSQFWGSVSCPRTDGWLLLGSNRRFHLVDDSCPAMSSKKAQNKHELCILDWNLTDTVSETDIEA